VTQSTSGQPRPANLPQASQAGIIVPKLFEPSDILAIGKISEIMHYRDTVDLGEVASDLNTYITIYIQISGLARERAPWNEIHAWFSRVEAEAAALLGTLGLATDDWAHGNVANQSIKLLPALRELRAGAVDPPGPFPAGIPVDVLRIFGEERFTAAIARAEQLAADQDEPLDASRALLLSREATEALLPLAPRVLGLLVALARSAKAIPRRGPQHGGRRPDEAKSELFRELVGIYSDIFGDYPVTRDKLGRRISSAPAFRWMRGLLRMAAERLSEEARKQREDARSTLDQQKASLRSAPQPSENFNQAGDAGRAEDAHKAAGYELAVGAHLLGQLAEQSDATLCDLVEAGKAAARARFRGN
jgi:hypothetical protein